MLNLKVKIILSVFASVLFVIPVYIVLHEGGHALIAIFCGAQITKFSILGAYMSFEGGTFTNVTLSLLNVAGMIVPVLVAIVYMLIYQNKIVSIPYRIFSFMFSLIPICSVLAWLGVPVLYLLDKAPRNDDVTKFINNSGLPPLVVLLVAAVIFTCCIFIMWKKKIIQNYWSTVMLKV